MNAHTNKGRFGKFGGRYVPETLVPALDELEYNYKKMRNDARFKKELAYLRTFAGSHPDVLCESVTKYAGTRIYLKREDILHGGAQRLGQALLAKRMGKTRIRISGEPENMCGCVTPICRSNLCIISCAIIAASLSSLIRPAEGDAYFISHMSVGCLSCSIASFKSKSECIPEISSSISYTPESMALREFSTSFSSMFSCIFTNLL